MEKECSLKAEACKYVDFGCKAAILGGDDKKHNKACLGKHFDLAASTVKKQSLALYTSEKQVETLQETSKTQQTTIKTLNKCLAKLGKELKASKKEEGHTISSLEKADRSLGKQVDALQKLGDLHPPNPRKKKENARIKKGTLEDVGFKLTFISTRSLFITDMLSM